MSIRISKLLTLQACVFVLLTVNLWSQEAPLGFDAQNGLVPAKQFQDARQAFEEVEEITFSLKRHRKVTFDSESTDTSEQAPRQTATSEMRSAAGRRIASSREEPGQATYQAGSREQHSSLPRSANDTGGPSLGSAQHERQPELAKQDGPRELRGPEGPRQLPPASDWE